MSGGTKDAAEVYENGVQLVSDDNNHLSTPTVLDTWIGGHSANKFKGEIAEICFFETAIASTDLTAVTNYLRNKYAI